MELDWSAVRARYADHPRLPALRGGSTVRVTDVDDDRICVRHRLWHDCIGRDELETALGLLERGEVEREPMAFAEGMRRWYSSGPQVRTGCTRGPNLAAMVLADLGHLTGE